MSHFQPSSGPRFLLRPGNLCTTNWRVPVCIYPSLSSSFVPLTAFHFLFVTLPATSCVVPYGFVIVPRHLSDPGCALSDALFCCTRSLYQAFIHTRSTMRPRRNPTQPHALSPHDPSPISTTSTTAFPRASSPSGFSQLLSKPAKWFTRNHAGPRATSAAPSEPRSSSSSFVRKPKISHPTDLRPILPSLQSEPYIQSPTQPTASRSVSFVS